MLVLDGSGQPSIIYCNTSNDLKYAPDNVHYITDSIASTLSPPAVYSPTAHAILWQGTLLTDAMQTIQFRVVPSVTVTEPLSLAPPIVNTAWLTDTYNGEGISAAVIVNGHHVYLSLMVR